MAVTASRDEYETTPERDLGAVIAHGIRAVYQPIVDLDSGAVMAYEALARGPVDSPFASPGELFGAAHREGRMAELDRACRTAALQGAMDAGLRPPAALFVNVEPEAIGIELDDAERGYWHDALTRLSVFFEVTRARADAPSRAAVGDRGAHARQRVRDRA